jgi:preprotein translocase subunit SecG
MLMLVLVLVLVLMLVVLLHLQSSNDGLLKASAPRSASLLLPAVAPEWCKARAANYAD